MDAELTLNTFIQSARASFPAGIEKIVTYLKDQEEMLGKSIVARRGADSYDVTVSFLIQLLCQYPDELTPVAGAVRFLPRPRTEIEKVPGGDARSRKSPQSQPESLLPRESSAGAPDFDLTRRNGDLG